MTMPEDQDGKLDAEGVHLYAGCLTLLISVPVMMVTRGLVFLQLFKWFVEPLIGLHLTLIPAMGMILIVGLLSRFDRPKTSQDRKNSGKSILVNTLKGLLTQSFTLTLFWGLGALLHWLAT